MTSIESMMSKEVVTVEPGLSVKEAADLMKQRNLGALVVTDGGKIHGMFSERDVLNRVVAEGRDPVSTKVEEVCTKAPVTVRTTESVDNCYRLIRDSGFRHLPIANESGEPVGIVSARDFLRCLMVQAEGEVKIEDVCAKLGQLTQLMECMDELRGEQRA